MRKGSVLGVLGLTAVLATATARADDILALRSGETRSGKLKSCAGDRCQLDGQTIARADIAWIGIAQAAATPPPLPRCTQDLVMLVDGRTRSGQLGGIGLGVVALGAESLDRREVAWIRFADPEAPADPEPSGAEKGSDAAVLRDGAMLVGEIEGCAGGQCWMAGATPLARTDIAALLFAVSGDAAVPAAELEQDRVLLRDGGARDGVVYGVSSEDVVAITGTYERRTVAAVLFAPAPANSDGVAVAPSPDPGSAPGAPPSGGSPSDAPAPGAPPAAPSPPSPGGPRPAG